MEQSEEVLPVAQLAAVMTVATYRWSEVAVVVLFVGPAPVGSLGWDLDSGDITMVQVDPEHRRKGYATAMWRAARSIAQQNGWKGPLHDPLEEQSNDARAWAPTLGD